MDVHAAASLFTIAGRGGSMTEASHDELLLHRAKRGDREARCQLVQLYQKPVYALVARMMVAQRHAIDDVAQDSMIKVLEALPSFDPRGKAKLQTWILTITARTCIDALRRTKKLEPVEDHEDRATIDEESRAFAKVTMSKVEAAMAKLPDDHRAVLVLRAYHDLDYAEIATALGVEEGTVKSRLARARAALKTVMEPV
jgi:RNA polymerase sigma-70 factor (ECF subfamily)